MIEFWVGVDGGGTHTRARQHAYPTGLCHPLSCLCNPLFVLHQLPPAIIGCQGLSVAPIARASLSVHTFFAMTGAGLRQSMPKAGQTSLRKSL